MGLRQFFGLLAILATLPLAAQNLEGNWQTSVQERGRPERYVLHIATTAGSPSATLDVPARFQFGSRAESFSFAKNTLRFRTGLAEYEGQLSTDSQSIQGTWSVGLEKQKVVWQRATSNAPDRIETVATRLKSLMRLPADEWKFHLADIDHGEAIDLDDSSWSTIRPNGTSPYEALWYRRWIEVPKNLNGYDLTGARIWFSFQIDANGPVVQIIYFNGRRVAMGDDLEPIVLFDNAKPGDKVLVAVKLLHTVDQKHFSSADLRIDIPNARPNPEYLLQEMGTVSILAPYAGSPSERMQKAVAGAADAVDLNALANADQSAFDTSLTKARALLEPVKPDLQQTSVRLTGNAHIDAAWLWPWTETVDVVRRTFGTAIQLMDEYPQYTYTQSAAAYSEWVFEKYPSLYKQILDRVKQGRWELVGGMWVEPDLNMPDGESLVRQILVGKRYFKEKFGTDVRIGWNPDSFGYNWQLPQIYKK